MKWLCLVLLSSVAWGQSHEILRPTTDVNAPPLCAADNAIDAGALPNSRDAAGLSTFSQQFIDNPDPFNTEQATRVFSVWGTTMQTYTALTLNVNSSGFPGPGLGGEGTILYSIDSGAHWTVIRDFTTAWNQTTDTVTLSAGQDLTKLKVAVCSIALVNSGSDGQWTTKVWDIWTDGTYTPATPTPTPTPVVPPPAPAIPHPSIFSRILQWPKLFLF